MEPAELLKNSSLFSGFTDKEIHTVISTAKEREFSEGEMIIEEGHEGGRGFYLLLAGTAQVRKGDIELANFGVGDYFGEMALLLEDTPRTTDVIATSDATCLVITQWDLRALLTTHPQIAVKMMAELARRLAATDAALKD
jgi:CRP-like cAMP-binding protein